LPWWKDVRLGKNFRVVCLKFPPQSEGETNSQWEPLTGILSKEITLIISCQFTRLGVAESLSNCSERGSDTLPKLTNLSWWGWVAPIWNNTGRANGQLCYRQKPETNINKVPLSVEDPHERSQNLEIIRFQKNEIIRFQKNEIIGFQKNEIIRFQKNEIIRFQKIEIIRFQKFENIRFQKIEIIRFQFVEIIGFQKTENIRFQFVEIIGFQKTEIIRFQKFWCLPLPCWQTWALASDSSLTASSIIIHQQLLDWTIPHSTENKFTKLSRFLLEKNNKAETSSFILFIF